MSDARVTYPIRNSHFTKLKTTYAGILDEDVPKAMAQYNLPVLTLEEAVDLAPLGAAIAFPMKFIGSSYKVYDKNGLLVDRSLDDFRLPAVHLATFSRTKLKEVTSLGSGRGSVKEFDGHDDWQINISGLITPEENHPQGKTSFLDILEALEAYNDCMNSIEVSSELLTVLGVYRVAIIDTSYSQIQGTKDNLEFSMTLLSDQEFELEIIA